MSKKDNSKYYVPALLDISLGSKIQIKRHIPNGFLEMMKGTDSTKYEFSNNWNDVVFGDVILKNKSDNNKSNFDIVSELESFFYLRDCDFDLVTGSYRRLDFYLSHNALRVKYIDKEQIESEGWEFVDTVKNYRKYYLVFNKVIGGVRWFVYFNETHHLLSVFRMRRSNTLFQFTTDIVCRSINDFNRILRLLGISEKEHDAAT